jgi:hypothetical protein
VPTVETTALEGGELWAKKRCKMGLKVQTMLRRGDFCNTQCVMWGMDSNSVASCNAKNNCNLLPLPMPLSYL